MKQVRLNYQKLANLGNLYTEDINFHKAILEQCIFCHNSGRVRYLTRIYFGFNRLLCHKFKDSLQQNLSPLCTCKLEVKITRYFYYTTPNDCRNLPENLYNIESSILDDDDSHLAQIPLCGNAALSNKTNMLDFKCIK